MSKILLLLTLAFLFACSSEPKVEKPAWINEPTRVVDNGYIVYTGVAEDLSPERAQFKAEGIALEDMANECSFIPKGARIEDRYSEKEKYVTKAYVKLGLEFTECDKAKHTLEPEKIKELANVAFTDQIRKYQDLTETGNMPNSTDYAALDVSKPVDAVPARGTWSDTTHFYVVRQYIAFQKEVVILSPPTAYAPASPETQHFVAAVQPATTQIQTYQAANPALEKQPEAWSKIPDRPKMTRPDTLTSIQKAMKNSYRPLTGGKGVPPPPNSRGQQQPKKKKRRRH